MSESVSSQSSSSPFFVFRLAAFLPTLADACISAVCSLIPSAAAPQDPRGSNVGVCIPAAVLNGSTRAECSRCHHRVESSSVRHSSHGLAAVRSPEGVGPEGCTGSTPWCIEGVRTIPMCGVRRGRTEPLLVLRDALVALPFEGVSVRLHLLHRRLLRALAGGAAALRHPAAAASTHVRLHGASPALRSGGVTQRDPPRRPTLANAASGKVRVW